MSDSLRDQLREQLQAVLGNSYVVERELGRGGMAVVYLAGDARHHRRVAIKVFNPELAGAIGAARFLREIDAAAGLNHPNILPLHDSGAGNGLLYYVMPIVEGGSLRDRLDRERQLPLEEALRLAREVADALNHAHGHGVVHRDIKPENVLLQAGHALVSDFGIARALDGAGTETLTATGLAVGTPAYMSPEQAAGERTLDARSDVYSLGCLVYEMLAGSPPYTGATPQAVLARKMVEPVPSLRVVRDTLPESVEAAVTRALAKVPADRFPTTTAFADSLEHALTAPQRTGRASRPRFVRAAVPGVVALVGVAALFATTEWGSRRLASAFAPQSADAYSLAVLPLENLSGDADQEYFVAGVHTALIGELARIGALRVISRSSVLRYRDSDKSLADIARELRVDGLMEGAVLRDGDSVRVQVQLIRANPERNLWTEAYERHVRDVLSLNGDIARMVAQTVDARVAPREASRLGRTRPVDPRARDAYLRGVFHLGKGTPQGFEVGMRFLHDAVGIDPADALSWAHLAAGYSMIGHDSDPRAFARAKAAAIRALDLDAEVAEAHSVLGELALYTEYDADAAERHFARALARKPSMAPTRYHRGWALSVLGRKAEALAEQRLAETLDPLSALWPASVAWFHYWYGGTADEIIAQARRALELDPVHPISLYALGAGLVAQGAIDDAIAAQEPLRDGPFWYGLARTYALAGRTEEARRLAARAERTPGALDKWGLAEVYAALGDRAQAMRWLEAAYDARFSWLPWIRVNPALAPLRNEQAFEALAARVRATEPLAVSRIGLAP